MDKIYQDFYNKYLGVGGTGNTSINKGECVGLVSVFMDVFNIPHVWGNAKDLYANAPSEYFEKIANSPTNSPMKGDIVIMNALVGGGYGHTGIATGKGDAKTFEMLQQNDPTGTAPSIKTYSYTNAQGKEIVTGWLRIKSVPASVQVSTTTSQFIVGNDISKYQGVIDWPVYKNNTNFVIINSTYGDGFMDETFTKNRQGARDNNIPLGFYHYAYPHLNSPEAEADWAVLQTSDIREGESMFLDYEEDTVPNAVDWAKRFLDRVAAKRNGYKAIIYLNQNLCKKYDWKPLVDAGYKLWIADYTGSPTQSSMQLGAWQTAVIQQWTNKQTVPAIANPVDGDVFFGDVAGFKALGYAKPVVVNPPTPAVDYKALYETLLQSKELLQQQYNTLFLQNGEIKKQRDFYKVEHDNAVGETGYIAQIKLLKEQKEAIAKELSTEQGKVTTLTNKYNALRKSGLKFIQHAVILICEKLLIDISKI